MLSSKIHAIPVAPGERREPSSLRLPATAAVDTNSPAHASRGESLGPLEVRPMPAWKRGIDIVGATLLIAALSPLFAGLATAILVTSRGPIFFRQRRHGLGGELFTIWKFRTLRVSACTKRHKAYVASLARSNTPLEKIDNHADLIPLGRWYRAFGLDELPQLFNVLCGHMSLVGPRPDVLTLADYETWQLRRFAVPPGITGLWQVSGKNRTTFDTMMRLDLQYVDEHCFQLDCKILMRTLPAVIRVAMD